jgi:hypothetical protein
MPLATAIANSKEAFSRINSTAQESLQVWDALLNGACTSAKTLGQKALHNSSASAETAFDTAMSIARAKTYPEVMGLQLGYMQKQAADMNAQAQEYADIAFKFSHQMFDAFNAPSAKNLGLLNKAVAPR